MLQGKKHRFVVYHTYPQGELASKEEVSGTDARDAWAGATSADAFKQKDVPVEFREAGAAPAPAEAAPAEAAPEAAAPEGEAPPAE